MKFFKQVSACTWSVAQLVNENLGSCLPEHLQGHGTLAVVALWQTWWHVGPSTKARNQKPCVLEYILSYFDISWLTKQRFSDFLWLTFARSLPMAAAVKAGLGNGWELASSPSFCQHLDHSGSQIGQESGLGARAKWSAEVIGSLASLRV